MASTLHQESISPGIRGFSQVFKNSGSNSDTAQALVSHVEAESDGKRKIIEEKEKWRRWWQQPVSLTLET